MSADSKTSWLPGAAAALAILSCYGTTVLIGLLSLLGISLAINEGIWAAAISAFAILATIGIATSYRRHGIIGPTVVAVLGLGLILWVMYGSYSRGVELVGFVLLIVGTLWDWRAAGVRRDATADGMSWIEADDLADRIKRASGPVVVDVRGQDEFNGPLGRLQDARNIPVDVLQLRLPELAELKNCEIVLVCRTQMRSAKAAALLTGAGFGKVRVLRGGMEQWNKSGLPIEGQPSVARP